MSIQLLNEVKKKKRDQKMFSGLERWLYLHRKYTVYLNIYLPHNHLSKSSLNKALEPHNDKSNVNLDRCIGLHEVILD